AEQSRAEQSRAEQSCAGNLCFVVMYNYVRELSYTRYPDIKGLTVPLFKEQIAYLQKYYHFVRVRDIIAAVYEEKSLPENAVWLTFDDGYADHYQNVFPILDELGIEGAFFVPGKTVMEHKVLDVNKVHFVLASVKDVSNLLTDIYRLLDKYRDAYALESNDYYFQKLAKANRFDLKEVIFVKRLLQVELPEELRNIITDNLFRKYVSENEVAFAQELYMTEDQLRCMLRHGMYVGSHGYGHYWLDSLPREKQADEVDRGLDFLKCIGSDTENWIMNYPYGAYNNSLIEIIRNRGCKLGLSTRVAVAELTKDNAFTLPRLDTNDLPKDRNAEFSPLSVR
ncbi:MAG: polysaccharide deacetylase family protein, partial [Fretibacterium sp.]|nr:polysaccharide deacetylase family protein [Fretibacterium sp.]